ncbi:uncharacterized protein LOC110637296 [Hevea brasiliensis]|uniref:uncharacterized protein LOC110637296 n=1 Tax=Hevea brasiliensis TaxID=3981 RepID=UPI0025FBAE02|nr:uncharacterized protein LOC110637296 [Hevea brasiliensis]XP_057985637.1 uncharacterized protein LOC110637296 [Hevea brasiliensis]
MFLIFSRLIRLNLVGRDLLAQGQILVKRKPCSTSSLKYNDQPHPDYGMEVMFKFAGFDPFERSTYFGPFFDLGKFEGFRRIFHHSTYRVLLGHRESKILSSLLVKEL